MGDSACTRREDWMVRWKSFIMELGLRYALGRLLSWQGMLFKDELQEYNVLTSDSSSSETIGLQDGSNIGKCCHRGRKTQGKQCPREIYSLRCTTSPPCHCLPVMFTDSRKVIEATQMVKGSRKRETRRLRQSLDRGNELKLHELAGG